MNINEIKKYAQRPPTDIEIFVELGDKIQNEINFLNKQAKDNKDFIIDTKGNVSEIVRRFNVEFTPAGADSSSVHKIRVTWNIFDINKWDKERCQLKLVTVDKGKEYYTTKNTWKNSVRIEQKIKRLSRRSKSGEYEDRSYYQFGNYGDKVTLKDHDKIVDELVRRIWKEVKYHENQFKEAKLKREKIASLENLPFATETGMYARKDDPRSVCNLKEDVSAKVHFHNSSKTNKWFSVEAKFDNLTMQQLEWVVKLLKQVDVENENLDHKTYKWDKKGELYKIVKG